LAKSVRTNRLIKLARAFPSGAREGMLFFTCLFAFSLFWNGGFSVMGVSKGEVAKLVMTSFWPWVLAGQVKILIVYLAAGLLVGLSAELVASRLLPKLRGARLGWIFAVNAYFLAINIRKYPQLYTESLYDRGGLFKLFEVLITHKLPQFVFNGAGTVLLSAGVIALGLYLARALKERVYLAAFGVVLLTIGTLYAYLPWLLPPKNSGPNVMVIAADSFRNDRLGAHGYARHITPNIDKIAGQGVVFNSAFTSFPRTFPAIISLLTGQLPVTHGVRHMFPDKYSRDHTAASVVELLRKNGYSTAVVSDFAGDVFSRMRIGFESVKAPYFNFITLIDQRSLEVHFLLMPYVTNPLGRKLFPELKEFAGNGDPSLLADETIDTLSGLTRRDKFFCFVFFSNIHFPYASPYPYYRRFTDPGYSGRFKYQKPPAVYADEKITGEDIEQIHALYDGSVEAFDAAAGRIIDYLKKRGCLENTIVIVTADHGENLYENGWYIGHGEHLRGDKVLNVPLVIKFPGNKYTGKVDCLTRDIDVAPTLLDYLGLKTNSEADGRSMMPLLDGRQKGLGVLAFAETGVWFSDTSGGFFQKERIMYPDITAISTIDFTYNLEVVLKKEYEPLVRTAKHRMVDDGRFRLIYVPEREGVRYELYDRVSDPAFANDIAAKDKKKVEELKKKLFEFMQKDRSIVFRNGFAVQAK